MWKDWVTYIVQVPGDAVSSTEQNKYKGRDGILGALVTRRPVSTNPPNILSLYLCLDPRQESDKARDNV